MLLLLRWKLFYTQLASSAWRIEVHLSISLHSSLSPIKCCFPNGLEREFSSLPSAVHQPLWIRVFIGPVRQLKQTPTVWYTAKSVMLLLCQGNNLILNCQYFIASVLLSLTASITMLRSPLRRRVNKIPSENVPQIRFTKLNWWRRNHQLDI